MEQVRNIIAKTFRIREEDITDKTTMEEIDTWDSLTHMELIVNLESELNIEFDGDEIAEMISVGAIEKAVASKR